jgi:CRISPR-associated protein Cas5t
MLLSLVGERDRLVHRGTELSMALLSDPQTSVLLRTLWRVKDKKVSPGRGNNKRPDFQELLTDVRLVVWLRQGSEETARPTLFARVQTALKRPHEVSRFGGLSLGESTHLVNEVREWRQEDMRNGRVLIPDNTGDLSLPIWPDHVSSQGTRWGQFRLKESVIEDQPDEQTWIRVKPPEINE